jgi:hypothetical protein
MLGYIVRKQPTWLRLRQTCWFWSQACWSWFLFFQQLTAKLSNYLSELFEVFNRLCLYAYFQRVYIMFPRNFLAYMRQQYLDTSVSSDSSVFADIISPLLATVRQHPLLVTQNREHEKTTTRWKGMAEVHNVVAECSRYSLDVYESVSRPHQPQGCLVTQTSWR